MGVVFVFHGLESIEPTNRRGIRLEQGRRASHDGPIARRGCGKKKPVELTGVIEADEVYIVAGHKGHLSGFL